jgi:hypothetical protein
MSGSTGRVGPPRRSICDVQRWRAGELATLLLTASTDWV